jgi:Tfp pilus assembly protein PilF
MTYRSSLVAALLLSLFATSGSRAQSAATVKEYVREFTTYPFSDPDPIPSQTAIYPYFRYDGFTDKPEQRSWKVVELENDYIRVMILPEVGGKIWTAIDKTTGQPFIYFNSVVKFRDIAMRGPWTSGGIEANYGIIGHTPNCATPVDYRTRTNEDGSASCFIGVLDLLTRTRWQIEVRLPRDRAWFSTGSTWGNPTGIEQPYYHWMNVGIRTKGDLEYIFPGTAYVGHEGERGAWPVNESNGKRINFYEQNDFGTYKSYHVIGSHTDFFGAYWHADRNGMVRYAPYGDKAGKKIWIWGLSRQGMIWERMLTDTDGQYSEIQSGRLFNQNAVGSTFTPFKHLGFHPHATDRWTEYWYPVNRTRGMVVANEWAALNLRVEAGWVKWYCSPAASFADTLRVTVDGRDRLIRRIEARPLQTLSDSFRVEGRPSALSISIPGRGLQWSTDGGDRLSRPLEKPAGFDWSSAAGLALMGREQMEQRMFREAEESLRKSLDKDPLGMAALVAMAELSLRNGDAEAAFGYAGRALAVDAHDGAANYHYGLAAARLGREADAMDGFGIAAMSPAFRTPAYVESARLQARRGRWEQVLADAERALDNDRHNVTAQQLRILACRLTGDAAAHRAALAEMERRLPLEPFIDWERASMASAALPEAGVVRQQNEMPWEGLLELAAFYLSAGRGADGRALLAGLPAHPLALYWRAWLERADPTASKALLARADSLPVGQAFAFREEMLPVLRWAAAASSHWRADYHLALLLHHKNRRDEALALVRALADRPEEPAFYALRALWTGDGAEAEADLRRAMAIDPAEWRYPKLLAQLLIRRGDAAKALAVADGYVRARGEGRAPVMDMLLAKSLLLNGRYADCDALLSRMRIIPFEGSTDGRALYWEAKMMLAVQAYARNDHRAALRHVQAAAEWPEHLGVGKPYDADIDARLEKYLSHLCLLRLRRWNEAEAALADILAFQPSISNTITQFQPANHLVTKWAMEAKGDGGRWDAWMQAQEKAFPRHAEAFARVRRLAEGMSSTAAADDPWMRVIQALQPLMR